MGVEIVRHGRRYDGLTSEGMRVLSWAQQMYDVCKGLERELSALRRGIEGQFRLGILPGTAGVAPTLSIALAEKTPLLQQSVLVSGASSLLQAIRENNLDIALMHLEDIPGEDFDTHLLYRERIFLFHAARTQQPRSTTWDHVLNRQLCVLNSAVPEPIQDRLMQCTAQTIRPLIQLTCYRHTWRQENIRQFFRNLSPANSRTFQISTQSQSMDQCRTQMSDSLLGKMRSRHRHRVHCSKWCTPPNSPPLFNPLYRSIVGSSPKQTHLKAP